MVTVEEPKTKVSGEMTPPHHFKGPPCGLIEFQAGTGSGTFYLWFYLISSFIPNQSINQSTILQQKLYKKHFPTLYSVQQSPGCAIAPLHPQ